MQIGAVTVERAVDGTQHLTPDAQVFDVHHARVRAQRRQQGDDLVRLLEIDIRMVPPGAHADGKAEALQALGQHGAGVLIPEGDLQMIPLPRVSHGAAAKEHAAQKRAHAASAGQRDPGRGGLEGKGAVRVLFHHTQRAKQSWLFLQLRES